VDHFGNLVTGLRADNVPRDRGLTINRRAIRYARVFSEVKAGELFWYENSLGLVEVAANSASAQQVLGFKPGSALG
jgi:S-adenosylmethionine hydrolase